jgi:hypothetical protein
VVVLLDWEGLETVLPNVAAGLILLLITACVRGQQPVHEAAKVVVAFRPEGEVEMVGHQAKGDAWEGGRQPVTAGARTRRSPPVDGRPGRERCRG